MLTCYTKRMNEFHFFRHGNANYKEYEKIREGKNPQESFNPQNQDELDLTEAGRELSQNKANIFFNELDPHKTKLFFVSSNEARAIETASIFKKIAEEKGFNILTPENTRSDFVDKYTDGNIRVIDSLSINPQNILMAVSIFNTGKQDTTSFFDKLDEQTKEKWIKVRNIIDQNDKGSWAKNYKEYGEMVKGFLPDQVKTTQDLYENNFKNIKRLIQWSAKKIEQSHENIKVIGFGHEDYMLEFLNQEFEEEGIKNCEMINFSVDNNSIDANFRNKNINLDLDKSTEIVNKKAA